MQLGQRGIGMTSRLISILILLFVVSACIPPCECHCNCDTLVAEPTIQSRMVEATPTKASPTASTPIPLTPASKQWLTLENELFSVRYQVGNEQDAQMTLEHAMWVRDRTMEKYPHNLATRVTIQIYDTQREIKSDIGVLTAQTHSSYGLGANGREYSSAIYILSPSWEGDWGGYERMDNPFRRVLNHEYVHVPFYKDLYSKRIGYKESPEWFSQGLAEYISGNYDPAYREKVQEAAQSGFFLMDDPYAWGLYAVEYMYEEYGQEKVINLIRSDAKTFGAAIEKELGVTPSEFEKGLRAYLVEKLG